MSTAMLAALQASELRPAVFVKIQLASSAILAWSGIGDITWNSETWTGVGSLLSLTPIEDAATVDARGMSVTLSGIDSSLIGSDTMADYRLGLPATVYFGLFSAGSLIDSPLAAWSGRTDQPTIDVGGESATIAINLESRLNDMNVAVDRRYTNQDQQIDWPGDLCFQFVDGIQEMSIFWGRQANGSNNI